MSHPLGNVFEAMMEKRQDQIPEYSRGNVFEAMMEKRQDQIPEYST
jgi:hypothetical protein